jgi:hypothetical protein
METLSRAHQGEIKLNRFAQQYIQTHDYLDRNWPAAKEAFMNRPENRLFTQAERDHPEMIAPSYYPRSLVGNVAKTKAFIRQQGLKDNDPVAVDDYSRPPGPDGVQPRKLVHAGDIMRLSIEVPK